jgi:hypothetical protein
LLPPYYRGCWHGVSRSFLVKYRQKYKLLIYIHFFFNDRPLHT